MADVVQMEHVNKMNDRNVAMVFASNMSQMSDPITALKYAVHVMNFLRTLIVRAIRERRDSVVDSPSTQASSDGAKLQHQISYTDVLKSPPKRSMTQVQNQTFSNNLSASSSFSPRLKSSIPTHNGTSNSIQEERNPDSNEGPEIKFFNPSSSTHHSHGWFHIKVVHLERKGQWQCSEKNKFNCHEDQQLKSKSRKKGVQLLPLPEYQEVKKKYVFSG